MTEMESVRILRTNIKCFQFEDLHYIITKIIPNTSKEQYDLNRIESDRMNKIEMILT